MKPSTATRLHRREASKARRCHRIAADLRPRRRVVDEVAAEWNFDWLMEPIRKQSKRRQAVLDAEAKAKAERRAKA